MPWRHLRRAALGIGIGIAACLALGQAAFYLVPPPMTGDTRSILSRPDRDQVEVVTLGNSLSVSIDFQTMGMTGQHLYVPASDLFLTDAMADAYLDLLPNVRLALLPVTIGLLQQDNRNRGRHLRDYGYAVLGLRSPALIDGDIIGWLRARVSAIRHAMAPQGRACVLRLRPCPEPPLSLDPDRFDRSRLVPLLTFFHRDLWRDASRPGATAAGAGRIVDLARDLNRRGVGLVLYAAPVSTVYLDVATDILRSHGDMAALDLAPLRDAVAAARADGLCIALITAIWAPDTDGGRADWFVDETHLGPEGARAFSARLAARLEDQPPCDAG